jgi:hypothetical protein
MDSVSKLKVLKPSDLEQFINDGYVLLREAFSPDVARGVREFLFNRVGVSATDRSTWKEPVIHLREDYNTPTFTDAFTQRLWDGFDDVIGEGRYHRIKSLGWWPISFPGFDAPPWQVPKNGWHVDGIQFHHHVNSAYQGLLPIFIFSDIGLGDGGTAVDAGSHVRTARILAAAEPDGLDVHVLTQKVNAEPPSRPIEMNGRAGDVVLLHPFMLHARSANTGNSVRFICNPCVSLKENMNLQRADGEYSPVEQAIVRALK